MMIAYEGGDNSTLRDNRSPLDDVDDFTVGVQSQTYVVA